MKLTAKAAEAEMSRMHSHWVNLKTRELWIHGVDCSVELGEPGVEYMMATKTIKNLVLLSRHDRRKGVTIYLHTCGGIWEEGMAIYDAIKAMPYRTTIICCTHARSMSSLIFQAGHKRLMLPHSCFMFHYGTLAVDGDAKTVYSNVSWAKHYDEVMLDIYVDSAVNSRRFRGAGRDGVRSAIRSKMDRDGDAFLTAEDAVEWGFADGIITKIP